MEYIENDEISIDCGEMFIVCKEVLKAKEEIKSLLKSSQYQTFLRITMKRPFLRYFNIMKYFQNENDDLQVFKKIITLALLPIIFQRFECFRVHKNHKNNYESTPEINLRITNHKNNEIAEKPGKIITLILRLISFINLKQPTRKPICLKKFWSFAANRNENKCFIWIVKEMRNFKKELRFFLCFSRKKT